MKSKALVITGAAAVVVTLAIVAFLVFNGDPPEEDDRPPIIVYNGSVDLEIADRETGGSKQWSATGTLDPLGGNKFSHSHMGQGPARFNVHIANCTPQNGQRNVRSLTIGYGASGTITVTIESGELTLGFSDRPTAIGNTRLSVDTSDRIAMATLVLPGNGNTKECPNPERIEIRQRHRN